MTSSKKYLSPIVSRDDIDVLPGRTFNFEPFIFTCKVFRSLLCGRALPVHLQILPSSTTLVRELGGRCPKLVTRKQ